MAATVILPADCCRRSRDVRWVLRGAAAAVALAAWIVVMVHLALIARAEVRLQHLVGQANAFAALPKVTATELEQFVLRRTRAMGLAAARITLRPDTHDSTTGAWQVERIEAPAAHGLPAWIRRLPMGNRQPLVGRAAETAGEHPLFVAS